MSEERNLNINIQAYFLFTLSNVTLNRNIQFDVND